MKKQLLWDGQDESINILLNLLKQSGLKSRITLRLTGTEPEGVGVRVEPFGAVLVWTITRFEIKSDIMSIGRKSVNRLSDKNCFFV